MAAENPTFGCGAFLPGYGPFSFEDFDDGFSVDIPDDPPNNGGPSTPIEPGIDVDLTTTPGAPNPAPGIGDTTPTPPTGGAGPGTGGTFVCRCRVDGPPTISYTYVGGDGSLGSAGTIYTYRWKQKCKSVNVSDTNTSTNQVNTYVNNILQSRPQSRVLSTQGVGDKNCTQNGACGGPCEDLVVNIFVPKVRIITPDRPIGTATVTPPSVVPDGGGGGGGGGGDGPIIIIDQIPTRPAGGGLSNVDTGGGGGGGGEGGGGGNGPIIIIDQVTTRPAGGGVTGIDTGGGGGGGGGGPSIFIDQVPTRPAGGGLSNVDTGGGGGGGGGGGPTIIINQTPVRPIGPSVIGVNSPAEPPSVGEVDTEILTNQIESAEAESSIEFFNGLNANLMDLTNPKIVDYLISNNPTGLQPLNSSIITDYRKPRYVKNDIGFSDIFADVVDSNVYYVLKNYTNAFEKWDSSYTAGVTPIAVYNSLNPETRNILSQIKNFDGTKLSINQIFEIVGTRVLDGTIRTLTKSILRKFLEYSQSITVLEIKRNESNIINEVFASFLIDKFKFPLDRSKVNGVMKQLLPNWKTLSSDIDRYIELNVGGELKRYYVNDDDTFVDRSTLSLKDGEYFDVRVSGKVQRLYAKSEKDHAYLIPENVRHSIISLLGGDSSRTLQVSASLSSTIEFNYSLSAPRQNFYFLSCVLSSINSSPVEGVLLQKTSAVYKLAEASSVEGLSAINAYIKYKANHRVFVLDDEDIMLDYIEQTSSVILSQMDVISDSPKENKAVPILTRQIPWYIIIYPTNRPDFNIFNSISKIDSMQPSGAVSRSLKFKTALSPQLNTRNGSLFVKKELEGINSQNVYQETGNQFRFYKIDPEADIYKKGYEDSDGNKLEAKQAVRTRQKSGFRIVKEIITELDNNYLLDLNGLGKNITEFDAFSRLKFTEFNRLLGKENFRLIRSQLRKGIINDVKVIPVINRTSKNVTFNNTQIIQKKTVAPADEFEIIKESGI